MGTKTWIDGNRDHNNSSDLTITLKRNGEPLDLSVANGVANANALSKEVLQYEPTLYNSYGTYFHSESFRAGDGDASNVTRGHVSACPDLNTANTTVQTKIYNLLKDCIDCGVDGFRFDAAKHIEVEDDASVGSQFWVNTLDAAKSYYSAKRRRKKPRFLHKAYARNRE